MNSVLFSMIFCLMCFAVRAAVARVPILFFFGCTVVFLFKLLIYRQQTISHQACCFVYLQFFSHQVGGLEVAMSGRPRAVPVEKRTKCTWRHHGRADPPSFALFLGCLSTELLLRESMYWCTSGVPDRQQPQIKSLLVAFV